MEVVASEKWDTMMSALVGSNPQAFLDLVLPGSRFIKHHRNKLAISERQPDAIIEAWHPIDKQFLFNPEFQTYKEDYIPERLLLYNVLLWWQYKLPVRSEVIYLTRNEEIEQPPLCWPTHGKRNNEQSLFDYGNTAMWKKSPEDLLDLNHMELIPLLPLTDGGMERDAIEYMFARLPGKQYRQLATMGFLFAALAFRRAKRKNDQEWLERRFSHMHDILRESPAYQWILDEGREEGREEGIQQGVQRGVQAMQQAAIDMVIARFAELESLARARITALSDLERLQHLIIDLSIARSPEEMKRVLLAIKPDA
jgi:predicted transposase YdaD